MQYRINILAENGTNTTITREGIENTLEAARKFMHATINGRLPRPAPAAGVVRFDVADAHVTDGPNHLYFCDQPGDMSGDYYPAESVAALALLAQEMKEVMGYAEWATDEHGADMFHRFINVYHTNLSAALAAYEAQAPK